MLIESIVSEKHGYECTLRGVYCEEEKKIDLTIEEKLEFINLLQKGTSCTVITEKYGIGWLTVADIKKSEAKIKAYKEWMTTMGIKAEKTKATKMGNYKDLDFDFYNSEEKLCL